VIVTDAIFVQAGVAKENSARGIAINVTEGDPVGRLRDLPPAASGCCGGATGNPSAFQMHVMLSKEGGCAGCYWNVLEKVKRSGSLLFCTPGAYYYDRRGRRGYEEALQLLEDKKLQITPMITHRFPLKETAKGFGVFEDKNAMPCAS